MTILFRVDASLQIGSGHVMRCLTLADELRQRGADVHFVCREHPGNLNDMIAAKGYPVTRLPQVDFTLVESPEDLAHMRWLGVAWEQDAAETVAAVGDILPQWLIIDHYAIDHHWEERLRPHVGKIMVIDDLADRTHDCNLLLDQNLYQDMESRYDTLVPCMCQKLLGPRYALLRPEFAAARKNLRLRSGEIKRVLIFFGGVDPSNETAKTLQAIASMSARQFAVDVVVGGGNPHKEQIQTICAAHDGFHYLCQVENMAALIAAADLAIGAGGATTLERCALGLPSLVIAVAVNQELLCEYLAKKGIIIYLGLSDSVDATKIQKSILTMIDDKKTFFFIQNLSKNTIDCLGSGRVAGFIFCRTELS